MTASSTAHGSPVPAQGRSRIVFWLLIGLATFYLLAEHRLHMAGLWRWLPLLILLACPLIHLFGHGGHGAHGADPESSRKQPLPADTAATPAAAERTARPHTHRGDLP